jgi:prepilin-type N-terminal cleavage/methylation domain-containing protein
MDKGLSLLELMIVLIIMAIALTFAMPSYAKFIDKNRAKNAEANLMVIYNMEKRYKLDNKAFYICPASCSLTTINSALGLFIRDSYYNYQISLRSTNGFKAIATHKTTGACLAINDASSTITHSCK